MNVYSIRDRVSEFSLSPFVAESDVVVTRMLRGEFRRQDASSNIVQFPGDFEINCIGTWSPETGVLQAHAARCLGTVAQLFPQEVDKPSTLPVDNVAAGSTPPTK